MSKPSASDGFSLLEMLVALAIFSLAAGVAYNGAPWRKSRETLDTLSQKITQAAATASLSAISKGETTSVEVDVASRLVSSGAGDSIAIPEPFEIAVLTGAGLIEHKRRGAIEFYSDGTSSGGEIMLGEKSGRTSAVRIYWLTGAITVKSGVNP